MVINDNAEADKLGKQTVEDERVEIELAHGMGEIKSVIKDKVLHRWQQYWDNETKGTFTCNTKRGWKRKK